MNWSPSRRLVSGRFVAVSGCSVFVFLTLASFFLGVSPIKNWIPLTFGARRVYTDWHVDTAEFRHSTNLNTQAPFLTRIANLARRFKFPTSLRSPSSQMPPPSPPYVLSDWERRTYYSGISSDPPELLYRSDLLENPFPVPEGRHSHLPTKTIHGVFNTPLNPVWGTVAPQIRDVLKARKIRYSAITTARFATSGEDGKATLGPVVAWIAIHPATTTAKVAYEASPDILALLRANGVEGVVVEWYEGVVERL